MLAYLSIVLLSLLILTPWAIRFATGIKDEGASIILCILLTLFGIGSFIFASRMLYLGLESYGTEIFAVAEVEESEE